MFNLYEGLRLPSSENRYAPYVTGARIFLANRPNLRAVFYMNTDVKSPALSPNRKLNIMLGGGAIEHPQKYEEELRVALMDPFMNPKVGPVDIFGSVHPWYEYDGRALYETTGLRNDRNGLLVVSLFESLIVKPKEVAFDVDIRVAS